MNAQSEYLSPNQAARSLEVSASTIVRWTKTGRLRVVQTPLGRLIPRDAVDELRTIKDWAAG